MRQRSKIVLWGLLGSSAVVVAIVAYVFVAARYFDSCGISESQARSMVLDHLASKDPAAEPRVNYYQHRGTCEHAFYYKGPAGEFDFVVVGFCKGGGSAAAVCLRTYVPYRSTFA